MNALVRKEVRSILPAWLLALALAILPVWLVWPGPSGVIPGDLGMLVFAPFGLGVLVLSLSPFGQELNWGTFSVLLSQPMSRRRLWLVKAGVLAVALGLVFLALWFSNYLRVDTTLESMKHTVWRNAFDRPSEQSHFFVSTIAETRRAASQDTLLIGGLEVLAGFAGGLWTTLLFRQITAAFWLTLLVPLGLTVLAGSALKNFPDSIGRAGLALILGTYSAAGFFWAKRFFLRVQDTQWTGGVIAFPSWGEFSGRRKAVIAARKRKPMRALLRKELQAQQVNVLLAAGLLLVHFGVIVVTRWSREYLATHQSVAMTLEMVPLLWLAMPLLVGSVSVAEERKLGMFQSSLCLPASRWVQFFTKLVVALTLGIVLGAILPLLIETLAIHKHVGDAPGGLAVLGNIRSIVFLQVAGAAGLTLLSFYGSTLTRNGLQAMGAGLAAAVIGCLLIVAAERGEGFEEFVLWRGRLIGLIGWPVMLVALLLLAYRNYKRLQPGLRTWGWNGATLLACLFCVVATTTTIYHRAWEAWLPEEPVHKNGIFLADTQFVGAPGARRNFVGANPSWRNAPKLQAAGFQEAAILPDGRLWLHRRQVRLTELNGARRGTVVWYATGPWHTDFVSGSNWKDVAITPGGCYGIQANGSLWDLSDVEAGAQSPKPIGKDRDWMQISSGLGHFCALKSDGTLWQWGGSRNPSIRTLNGTTINAPRQVGTDNDWVSVCDSWTMSAAIKADGSVWRWDHNSKTRARPEPWLSGACGEPVSMSMSSHEVAVVCVNGTLWIGGDLTNSVYARVIGGALAQRAGSEMVRWGNDSDWKEIRFVSWGKAVGLKRDGSLWEWNVNHSFGPWHGWVVPPTIISRYNDWVSVGEDSNAFLALARDGSLCLWGDPEDGGYDYDWSGYPNPSRLTMPSRIKATKIADLAR